ncbi:Endonuclease/exonuclease/phosphatase [Pseudocohnilembus persalinus]|uniref:Endonuclease/exonuclease/phosphatase n=1 Tax=Pseudocohnilembus persalinus TaxID=266149 RepID=A0A0V0QVG1_PSEPJ|nr:Endonuclease/exonuclease/phosphatase [Pseudocohnilembus persalinus]|eukprot:KRX06348.1 Endonuclease/exonuclease/phosphatase [Pseudocohnilembus persalinus]
MENNQNFQQNQQQNLNKNKQKLSLDISNLIFSQKLTEMGQAQQKIQKTPGLGMTYQGKFYDNQNEQKLILNIKKIKCITYNVWFEPHKFEERNKELCNIFLKYSPDFICLQEVTNQFMALLRQNEKIMNKYYITDNQIGNYGVLILSKYPAQVFEVKFTNSYMGRSLLYLKLNIDKKDIIISTSHLESLGPNAKKRKEQIQSVYQHFNDMKDVLFMGDFNFDSPQENNNVDRQNYDDLWEILKDKNEESYTMKGNSYFPPWRPDRILCKKNGNLDPVHIERIGTEPIPYYQQNKAQHSDVIVTPSDHFGLYAEFEMFD